MHRLRPLIIAAVLLGATAAGAGEVIPGPVAAEVLEVLDGDSVRVRARIWIGQSLDVIVRIRGIDAAELGARCPAEAALAGAATEAVAAALADRRVTLTDIEPDKYAGRVIADIAAGPGGSLGPRLVAAGFARPYEGGRRASWCETAPGG